MSLLIETLQIKNKEIQLLDFHQNRVNRSTLHFYNSTLINLLKEINIPSHIDNGVWKCRIIYTNIIKSIEFAPYTYRKIKSLQIIENEDIDYSYKYLNRDSINELLLHKKDCDDILICKNGNLTDTSFSNIALFNGEEWITPATYLLQGTKRDYLLQTNQIKEEAITLEDLYKFKKLRLLNCFYDLENGEDISIQNIRF